MDSTDIVSVNMDSRSYDIHVGNGILKSLGKMILERFGRRQTFVITDREVANYWLKKTISSLENEGIVVEAIQLPSGEKSKSFFQLESLIDKILDAQLARDGLIIALGGGVIGDLAGFAAAVTLRGIDFVQVPTTLLSQVDSSVGGKTGINTRQGKNLVGSFYQPGLVVIDTDVLDTLPHRQILAGYAEVLKYGLIKNRVFFDWLELNGEKILAGNKEARQTAIIESCKTKANIVVADEREVGDRALLNFGHTFAHALEVEAGFNGDLLHGEAVSLGMIMAINLSQEMGLCSGQEVKRVGRHMEQLGLPTNLGSFDLFSNWQADDLLGNMRYDKKILDGKMRFILINEIGDSFVTSEVDEVLVKDIIARSLAGYF